MVKANDYLGISTNIDDPAEYWKVHSFLRRQNPSLCTTSTLAFFLNNSCDLQLQLDDTILKTIEIAPDSELAEAKELILRVRRRQLYQVIIHNLFPTICLIIFNISVVFTCSSVTSMRFPRKKLNISKLWLLKISSVLRFVIYTFD